MNRIALVCGMAMVVVGMVASAALEMPMELLGDSICAIGGFTMAAAVLLRR